MVFLFFYFATSISGKDISVQISIPAGAYALETSNEEIQKNIFEAVPYTDEHYPIFFPTKFSTLGSFMGNSRQGPLVSFVQGDSILELLGFDPNVSDEKTISSPNPMIILTFDINFLETEINEVMIVKSNAG